MPETEKTKMNLPSKINMATLFKVDDWTVNPSSGLLIKDGEEVKLEPKVMEVLVYLAQNQGEVVSREALESEIWVGMIVGYDAVSGSIIKLRKALGDDSRKPRYIKTVSKRGYQLIVPVTTEITEENLSQVPNASLPETVSPENKKKIKQLAYVLGITVVVGLILMLFSPGSTEIPTQQKIETPSVVVLPFKNLGDDPQQEYLIDGITDDLITDLSSVKALRVIARQSSYHYKNNPAEIDDIARQLGVSYIVEGSVRKLGQQIRINVQLTDAEKSESIWAQRFDTDTGNIFNTQDEIIRNVLNAMVVTLSGNESYASEYRQASNFDAYDAFLVGQAYIKTRNRQGYEQAMKAFERALQFDPNYARAYGAMAVTLTRGYRYQWSDLSLVEARERALELVKKAVELDPTSPQIFWALAYVRLHRREFDEAEAAAKKSASLSPNYADTLALIANIANWRGKPEETIDYINKAKLLNPHYTFQYASNLGLAYYNLGQYPQAVKHLRDALSRNEDALNPRLYLAATYIRLNQQGDAEWEIEQISANRPDVALSNLDTSLPFEDEKYLGRLKDDLIKAGLSR